ncbi:ATP synthase gamma chain [Dehalococcoides mccartyi]|uniref:ATP synthase gamma chain n=2 Tax=Dehalococcoides mccartyi TaxID=61435 RepID=ATPG_DEHMC|nr:MULTISPECIES: ATP synthase F1 subunit gamma [Dehalococcoides]Q3ZZT8.1 RecName: Full=ATP synthase gamma chain; AltName: Full=ATP synthase F1 sector gamma subunit; AltName: Full=F-ATPase gamma subunit [Dehalococcoides mccartyi CBDB1]AGG06198.1 ATP synthase, subunit gamma [Dehalococcoides mccartyi DCMB5]AQU05646.1 ATP synthase subunit gamma [Dehalococcoides mccartyi]AQU07092.1 ATP synthase subunit gamma [Dehalococcoides mccartyi]RAL70856.1 ATP synthase gamma chain [Dehalococcoides mccartyi]CA
MANLRIIKRRIRSVRNIAKITRAMEMIAASKMKKAQERGLAGRPYSEKITEVIAALAALPQSGEILHPLLERRPVKKIAILHITPDRGQCGGLVANINRKTGTFIMEQKVPVSAVVVGRKGVDFIRRIRQQMRAEFINLGDKPDYLDTLPISRVIMDDFMSGEIDQVFIAYTQFVSTAIQNPVLEQLLPVMPVELPPGQNLEYIYEPESATVLNSLLPRFVEMSVYHAILESIASEQSARMVAMRNATDNAKELIGELTLVYNKARQESITNELLDIVGGAAALA